MTGRRAGVGFGIVVGLLSLPARVTWADASPPTLNGVTAAGEPANTAGAAPSEDADVEVLRVQRSSGVDAIYLRTRWPNGKDLVHDLGHVPSVLPALLGQPDAEQRSFLHAELMRRVEAEGSELTRHRLRLAPERTARLVDRLETAPSGAFRLDPLVDNGVMRAAMALDSVLDGALRAQGSLPARGDRIDWLRTELEGRTVAAVVAELVVLPESSSPLTAWDAAALPTGFERLLGRATIDGRPLVTGPSPHIGRDGSAPELPRTLAGLPGSGGWWAVLGAFALLASAALVPRAGALVWGGVAGLTGLLVLLLARSGGWTDIIGVPALALVPPTHLLLALLALSGGWWRRTGSLRSIYLGLSVIAAIASIAFAFVGQIPTPPPLLAIGSVLMTSALVVGVRREQRGPRTVTMPVASGRPRRAISAIEQRSPYLGSRDLRLR